MLYSRRAKGPLQHIKRWIFGSPLRNTAQRYEQLGILGGLAVLGSDALSSVAYATEEIMLGLALLGPKAFPLSPFIAAAIVLTLFIVIFSYRQTVEAYPNGGGAYTVSKHQLGRSPALIAASSLLMDYVLTVAVSIAAGVRALTSLFPSLYAYSIEISLGALLFLGWINLRGIRESVRVFAIPLYGFVVAMLGLCFYGFIETTLPRAPLLRPDWSLLDAAGLLIVLRAFSGGCTALTGIEAIANAGSLIKEPHVQNAKRLYVILASLLAIIFLSMTVLIQQFHIAPQQAESLLSQFARLLLGNGPFYMTVQLLTSIVLFLAANTAFADYPRLCAILARDKWLPSQLAALGDRLVFHKGIILLMLLAACFLIFFQADVHHLIPLYAIGVLTAFTLSQSGMMRYWLTLTDTPYSKLSIRFHAFISGLGALTTFLVLLIFFEAKFLEGAYLSLIVIPLLCVMCTKIQHHYHDVEKQLIVTEDQIQRHRPFSKANKRLAIVPISRIHQGSLEALAFAREMTSDVVAVLVDLNHQNTQLTKSFIVGLEWDIEVVVLKSPYRSVLQPLLEYLSSFEKDTLIIFPEIVPKKWWQRFLHNETVLQMIKALEWQAPLTGQTRIIITVPYHLPR